MLGSIRTGVAAGIAVLFGIAGMFYAMTLSLAFSLAAGRADADTQKPDAQVGSQVVLKSPSVVLKVGKRVVAHNDVYRVYNVARVNGPWLWVRAAGVNGWVHTKDVVPFDRAIDYFTGVVDSKPSAWAYLMRGLIWSDRKEYDIALGDFSEAIRLNPRNAATYLNRGNVWWDKKDLDRALSDYSEAIRLDPKAAMAYNNRGLVRHTKQQEEPALADFNEAIRLDPKNALAYNNRGLIWWAKKELDRALADFDTAVQLDPGYTTADKNRGFVRQVKKETDRTLATTTALKPEEDEAARGLP
jgi:tetratricopeptide (TPR) repeat protein